MARKIVTTAKELTQTRNTTFSFIFSFAYYSVEQGHRINWNNIKSQHVFSHHLHTDARDFTVSVLLSLMLGTFDLKILTMELFPQFIAESQLILSLPTTSLDRGSSLKSSR